MAVFAAGAIAGFMPWRGAQAAPAPLKGYLRTNWSRDPYSYGSYSYFAKGSRRSHREALQRPVAERLFFAGEAVFPKFNSTVHAAHESGLFTAKEVAKRRYRKVAIIGAGMSGLTAAHALTKTGHEVTVFEARDRIGGRIWTDARLGPALDLGASWIHGTRRNPVAKLARAAGQKTIATDDSYVIRGRDGRPIADRDAPDWLASVEMQSEAGADPGQIDLSAYENEPGYGGKEVIFPDGYSDVFRSLSDNYTVKLSQKLNSVHYDDNGVSLSVGDAEVRFEAVVVTVPLGVLKRGEIQFEPALPASKTDAISRLGMGVLDKLYLMYEAPFWDRDVTWLVTPENGLARGQMNLFMNLEPYVGAPLLCAFNGGSPAKELAGWTDNRIVQAAQETLAAAFG
ncbi:flavin monoamine oxidase family protein [Shimia abyssi]|nr:FAD-dependent oxidoreductase [Shimia abyssi]